MKKILNKIKNILLLYFRQPYIDESSVIGEYTYIGFNSFVTKATIGRYCSIANNVSIGPGEHSINKVSSNTIFYNNPYQLLTEKDIHIGHDVWIGVNAVIRRGISIGNGAIVGANSFVNSDLKAYGIYAGTPAVFIRMRFNDEETALIEKSRWWENDPIDAKKIINELKIDPDRKFLEKP